MIDKKIFYCWFGNNKKSPFEEFCINSWREQCPDYEIIEINENNFDININNFCKQAYENNNYAFVADVARMETLKKYSGFYLDTDILLLKSLDTLRKYKAIIPLNGKGFYNCAPIGCSEFINIYDRAYKQLKIGYCLNTLLNKCCYEEFELYGKELEVHDNIAFLGNEYFITPGYERTDKTIGIHYCLGTWLDKWQGGYDKDYTLKAFKVIQNNFHDAKTENKYYKNNKRIGTLTTYGRPMSRDLVFYGNYFYNPKVIRVTGKGFCFERYNKPNCEYREIQVEDVIITYIYKIRVAVDFDKCLIDEIPSLSTEYTLKKNAKKVINNLSKRGYEFVLNTSRYGWYYRSAVKFIKKEKLPIKIEKYKNKVPANIYIDDCNIFCKDIDWIKIEKELLNYIGG